MLKEIKSCAAKVELYNEVFPVVGKLLWERRKEQRLNLESGTHRFPFSIPLPRQGTLGGDLPESYYIPGETYAHHHHSCEYTLYAIVGLPW